MRGKGSHALTQPLPLIHTRRGRVDIVKATNPGGWSPARYEDTYALHSILYTIMRSWHAQSFQECHRTTQRRMIRIPFAIDGGA